MFFGLAKPAVLKDTTLIEEEIVNVEVWTYNEPRLYTVQESQVKKDAKKSYQTVINLNNDKDIKKKYIMKNKGNLGELMNEYQKELKKILLKDNVSLKNVEKYIKTLSDNECYFKNLIFISLKFYYYEIEFNYNDKIYKKAIIKTRGINNNICYNNELNEKMLQKEKIKLFIFYQ